MRLTKKRLKELKAMDKSWPRGHMTELLKEIDALNAELRKLKGK